MQGDREEIDDLLFECSETEQTHLSGCPTVVLLFNSSKKLVCFPLVCLPKHMLQLGELGSRNMLAIEIEAGLR